MPTQSRIVIGLNAVLATVDDSQPLVLCVRRQDGDSKNYWGLPYGAFNPAKHRTFELGLRDLVSTQTSLDLGFVEQLYTFGDKGRESPSAVMADGQDTDRVVSVGYLALTSGAQAIDAPDAGWRGWYDFFPWEDRRHDKAGVLIAQFLPALTKWAESAKRDVQITERKNRINVSFGLSGQPWEEERVLQRYELMYEAGIVVESWRDQQKKTPGSLADILPATGAPMASDHRRILATAIGRLRGKLRYRPVIFDLLPQSFTLLDVQQAVEAIIGFTLHKQNFRRGIEGSGLVEKTGHVAAASAGRPAALFRVSTRDPKALQDRSIQGLTLPRWRG